MGGGSVTAGDSAKVAALVGRCVVELVLASLATKPDVSAFVAARVADMPTDTETDATGCTKVRAATDSSATGRSINQNTSAAPAVAPTAAATTAMRTVRPCTVDVSHETLAEQKAEGPKYSRGSVYSRPSMRQSS